MIIKTLLVSALLCNSVFAEPPSVDHKYIAECWSDNVSDYVQVKSFFTLKEAELFIIGKKDCKITER